MSGKVALDTNIVIRHIQGDETIIQHTRKILPVLPLPVLAELKYAARNSARQTANQRIIEELLNSTEVLPLTPATTEWYAEIRWQLKKLGKPIPENDLWIAASCLEHGLPLATRDAHFEAIKKLEILNW